MPWGRLLRYGLLYWIIGVVITLGEAQFEFSSSLVTIVFYVSAVVMPVLFFWLYFRRGFTARWRQSLQVGIVWIILFTVLDGILYRGLFKMPWEVYFSWELLIEYILLAGFGVLVAEVIRQKGLGRQPEGLL
ncbi:hypothetical protein HY628_02970 [Candidatus Uhrbacteria bacterium]|nr:hypothetical protein [Candidatus Uhrbacteria bacterium]